jgi:hypothetical protein
LGGASSVLGRDAALVGRSRAAAYSVAEAGSDNSLGAKSTALRSSGGAVGAPEPGRTIAPLDGGSFGQDEKVGATRVTMAAKSAWSGSAGLPPPHVARLPIAVDGGSARHLRDVETRIGTADGLIE